MLSLRSLIGLTIVILVLLLATFHGVMIRRATEVMLEKEVGTSLSVVAESLSTKLKGDMQARLDMVSALAQSTSLAEPRQAQRIIDRLDAEDPALAWGGVTDANGTVIAGLSHILMGKSLAERPVYRTALTGPSVGDVHDAVLLANLLPNPTGEPMRFVDVSAPILGDDGRLLGVLAAHYGWDWARRVVNDPASPIRSREGLEVFLVARDGRVLLGPRRLEGQVLTLDSLAKAREGATGWQVEGWPDGRGYVTGYSATAHGSLVADLGWTVLVRQPLTVTFAPAQSASRLILWTGVVLATIFGAIGWLAAHQIARPLRAIAAAARQIRQGVETATIPDVGGTREIAFLSKTLIDLINNLRTSSRALVATNAALKRMEMIAYQDRLTSLPNRRFFEQYLEAARSGAEAVGGEAVLLYIDLDGFKPVNDRFGHDAGDEVLREVGVRLASGLRQEDVVARIGGDEFACVLILSPDDIDRAREVAGRLISSLRQPIRITAGTVSIGGSIGGARWPHDGETLASVMKRADEALYEAKRSGRNRFVFHADRVA